MQRPSRQSALALALTAACGLAPLVWAAPEAAEGTWTRGSQEEQEGASEPRLGASGSANWQDGATADEATTAEVLANADPVAADSWRRLLEASRVAVDATEPPPAPPQAFHLRADIQTRDGANTNELKIDYSFLSPSYVRFLLPSNRQTGRGPGRGLSSYWLKDGEDVQRLDTRDNKEDRRQVNEMIALGRNFLALTDPQRIRLTRLELLEGPPVVLPERAKDRIATGLEQAAEGSSDDAPTVRWIRLASPDFDLVPRSGDARDARRDQLVSLALGPDGLPWVAIVQDVSSIDRPLGPDASLTYLGRWVTRGEFRIPAHIEVYRPAKVLGGDPAGHGWAFGADPNQDIYLIKANLRPGFVPTDFEPN